MFENPLDGFVIASLRARQKDNPLQWEGKQALFHAETCARQLLVVTDEQLEQIPPSILQGNRIEKSTAAYKYLLLFTCGLLSPSPAEYHVSGQLRNSWKKYKAKTFSRPKGFDKFIENIVADSAVIRELILEPGFHTTSLEIAARTLLGMTGGEKVVIVGDKTGNTAKLAKALGRYNPHSAGQIMITHPDLDECERHYQRLLEEKNRMLIQSEIIKIPFFNGCFNKAIMEADHLAVCLPAGANQEANLQIMAAWQSKQDHTGKRMVHLGWDLKLQTVAVDEWAGLPNFISPQEVVEKHIEQLDNNKRVLERANKAVEVIADARSKGLSAGKVRTLIQHHLDDDKQTLSDRISGFVAIQQRFQSGQGLEALR